MGKIVAIGGGEIAYAKSGRKLRVAETLAIDQEIIALSGKKVPRLLFIPTASDDAEGYCISIRDHFTALGCDVDVLYLTQKELSYASIKKKILSSDIIYVGGGNTLRMMMRWRKFGVDAILQTAYKKDIVLSGLSAGSICWFRYGNSDSRRFTRYNSDMIKVRGLGLINALHCPHYDVEVHRANDLKKMMRKMPHTICIALDNCCAIEIVDDQYRIITSRACAKAYQIYWKKGIYYQNIIAQKNAFSDLSQLLTIS